VSLTFYLTQAENPRLALLSIVADQDIGNDG